MNRYILKDILFNFSDRLPLLEHKQGAQSVLKRMKDEIRKVQNYMANIETEMRNHNYKVLSEVLKLGPQVPLNRNLQNILGKPLLFYSELESFFSGKKLVSFFIGKIERLDLHHPYLSVVREESLIELEKTYNLYPGSWEEFTIFDWRIGGNILTWYHRGKEVLSPKVLFGEEDDPVEYELNVGIQNSHYVKFKARIIQNPDISPRLVYY